MYFFFIPVNFQVPLINLKLKTIYNVFSVPMKGIARSLSKQKIMPNNVETQNKHINSLFIGSLCNIAFPMARFTCILTSQVFLKI